MTWHFWGSSHARTVSDATKFFKSFSPRLPITLLPQHDATPSLSHHTLGCALSPKLLWDVPSPSPHSGKPSLWDAPPYFFFSFSFSANSLTVHRGPPLAHRRKGVGFFHNAAPFRSRSCGVTLHLVLFLYLFPFLFCSLTTLFLTCPFATCRVTLVASPLVAVVTFAPRVPLPQPSSATRRHHLPPLALGHATFPHLVLGHDATSPRLVLGCAVPHSMPFWFVFISFSFFADCSCEERKWGVPRAAPLPLWFVFCSFLFFFPAERSLPSQVGPPLVHKRWGSPLLLVLCLAHERKA